MAFLNREQLEKLGFKSLGHDVSISDKVSIYNPGNISIGTKVRIDDFSILSAGEGGIHIGSYVHIACYVSLIGKAAISVGNFVGISSKTAVYSSSDDYSGAFLIGPTIPEELRNVDHRDVTFEKYSVIGAGCVILPGVTISEGAAIGALSLVSKTVKPWTIMIGSPLKFVKDRKKDQIQLSRKLESDLMERLSK